MNNAKLRIVHTCPLGAGGITSMVLNICQNMDRSEVNFDYLVYRDVEEYNEHRARALGGRKLVADNETEKNGVMRFWMKFFRTYQVLKKERPDAFHINASTPYDTLVGIAAKAAGVTKVIVHSHNASNTESSKVKKLVYMAAKRIMGLYTDVFFTCSTEAAEFMFPRRIVKQKKYLMIKNGILISKFAFDHEKRAEVRKQFDLGNAFVIGNIGRLVTQKNQSFLLDVFKKISDKETNAILLLVGTGELEHDLKEKAKALGILSKVRFWGASESINELMLAMDVFVMTSLHEGLPVVGIEAQASGLPCVFADTITREVAASPLIEFISLEKTADEWANAVIEISKRTYDRRQGGYYVEKAGFSIVSVAKEMQKIYTEICS